MALFVTTDWHDCPAAKRRPRGFVPLQPVGRRCYEAGNQENAMTRATVFAIIMIMALLSIVGSLIGSARLLGWF